MYLIVQCLEMASKKQNEKKPKKNTEIDDISALASFAYLNGL